MRSLGRRVLSAAGVASAALAIILTTLGVAGAVRAADNPASAGLPSVAPATPWLPLPGRDAVLTRIGLGSCLHQKHPEPVWRSIIAARPQLFLMIGDNVYGDVKGPDMAELIQAYRDQGRQPEFRAARAAFPFLPIWDDHDYGANDSGAGFKHAKAAAALFHDFWQMKPERETGVYYARTFGPDGRRVQIIMLDVRTFRSPFKVKGSDFTHWGRYGPDAAPGLTMLGDEQWTWLRKELEKPADVRLLVSGIQILAEGHGFERWGNIPAERDKLLRLIDATRANGLLLVSGDRHMSAFYEGSTSSGRMVPEITASSLNRSYGPSKDARIPPLVTEPYHPENFALLDIDWERRSLNIGLKGIAGEEIWTRQIDLARSQPR